MLRGRRTAELLAQNCRWEYDDLPFWDGEVDCCINAATLSDGAWLGVDMSANAEWFVEHRLPDGGWNCDWVDGAGRSSLHSTISSLGGLLHHEVATGGTAATRSARCAGQESLLDRHLRRRRSTGKLIGDWVDEMSYPFRWPYSTLRALDYLRRAAAVDGTRPDDRLAEAVAVLRAARRPDGTWLQGSPQVGRTWFEVDAPEGEPSKWEGPGARRCGSVAPAGVEPGGLPHQMVALGLVRRLESSLGVEARRLGGPIADASAQLPAADPAQDGPPRLARKAATLTRLAHEVLQ